jgi:hypothetical protein
VRDRLPLSLGGSGLTGPPGLPRVATHVRTPAEAAIKAAIDDTNLSFRWQRESRLAGVRLRHDRVNVNVLSIDVMWRTCVSKMCAARERQRSCLCMIVAVLVT